MADETITHPQSSVQEEEEENEGNDDNDDDDILETMPEIEDMFKSLPTQVIVKNQRHIEIDPITSIDGNGPIQFHIEVGSNEQIYPAGIQIIMGLNIKDRITKQRLAAVVSRQELQNPGTPQEEMKTLYKYNPENANCFVGEMGHAAFQDIKVFINDTQIDGGDGLYPYRGAFYNRLFTSIKEKQHKRKSNGYDLNETVAYEDASLSRCFEFLKGIDGLSEPANKDSSFIYEGVRKDRCKHAYQNLYINRIERGGSDTFHFKDDLYSDIFQQPKPLPPGVSLSVHLTRSKPEFCLLNGAIDNVDKITACVNFEYCRLIVPVLEIEEEARNDMYDIAIKNNLEFQYPLRTVSLQATSRGSGMTDLSMDNILNGTTTPRRIFVALLKTEAIAGNYRLDPFNFDFCHLEEMTCKLEGEISALPSIKCTSQYDFARPVIFLQQTVNQNFESGITMDNFKDRNAIFAFDMTGLSGTDYVDCFMKKMTKPTGLLIRLGEPKRFEGNLCDISVLIYKEFDAKILIDGQGNVRTTDS